MALVRGRQIMDVVLIANEAVDSRISQNNSAILCKLDINKGYDHVNWQFLLKIHGQMDLGENWVKWISFVLSTMKWPVLISGAPKVFLMLKEELGKGPSTPFLFILAMEGLNKEITTTKVNGWITGFEVSTNNDRSLKQV